MTENIDATGAKFYGWINVALLFVIYGTTMGVIFYGFTYIFPAMIADEGWGRGGASFAQTLRGILGGFLVPLAAFSLRKIGAKRTMINGFLVGFIALALLGTATTELWQWTILWGIIMPFCFTMSGSLSVQTTIMYWFNIRRATAMGITLSSAPAVGFFAAPFFTYIIEKSGIWRIGWIAIAASCVLALIACFFVKDKPGQAGQYPDGINPEKVAELRNSGKRRKSGPHQTEEYWTLKEALRTRVVWLQLVCTLGQSWSINMVTVHMVLHLMDRGYAQMLAASIVGNLILFSGFARFPTGILADRIEPRILTTIALGGMALTILGLWKPPGSLSILLTISAIFGFCFGITVIVLPLLTANYFGPDTFAPINGFFTPIVILAGSPFPWIAGLIYDHFKSYDIVFIALTSLLFLGTISAWFLYPPVKKIAISVPTLKL